MFDQRASTNVQALRYTSRKHVAQSRQRMPWTEAQIDHKRARLATELRIPGSKALRGSALKRCRNTQTPPGSTRARHDSGLISGFTTVIGFAGFARRRIRRRRQPWHALGRHRAWQLGWHVADDWPRSMRLGLASGPRMLRRLLPLRRRNAGIVGRLFGAGPARLKCGDRATTPRSGDQLRRSRVFSANQAAVHPNGDSYSRCRRKPKKYTVPNTGPSSHHQTGVSNCYQEPNTRSFQAWGRGLLDLNYSNCLISTQRGSRQQYFV